MTKQLVLPVHALAVVPGQVLLFFIAYGHSRAENMLSCRKIHSDVHTLLSEAHQKLCLMNVRMLHRASSIPFSNIRSLSTGVCAANMAMGMINRKCEWLQVGPHPHPPQQCPLGLDGQQV